MNLNNKAIFRKSDIFSNVREDEKFDIIVSNPPYIPINEKANIQKEEIRNLKSQNIEGWSESYSTPEEIDSKLKIDNEYVLKEQLWDVIGKDGNYLLYRGV